VRGRKALRTMLSVTAAVLPLVGPKPTTHIIWNVSESVPFGLYWLRPIRKLAVTEMVAVQPLEPLATFLSQRGYLPRGVPMLKRVLGLAGQTVCRNGLSVTVDNVEMGKAREHDNRGRPLPVWQGCHVVAEGEVFLMNWQSVDSLDGRYFGVMSTEAIVGRAEPLWTREEN
jgi:conjugative transfer signal peptidase TraF